MVIATSPTTKAEALMVKPGTTARIVAKATAEIKAKKMFPAKA
jgi:hypothetical protein